MRGFSFRKVIIFWVVVVVGAVLFLVVDSAVVSKSNQRKYDKQAAEYLKDHLARKAGNEKKIGTQKRYGVIKRMWLSDKQPRQQIELRGAESEVDIVMKKSEARLAETFQEVQGIIQEDLFYQDLAGNEYVTGTNGEIKKKGNGNGNENALPVALEELTPMQRFRYFEADHAVYDYHTHTLIAYDVNFWSYTAKGHDLIEHRGELWPEASGSATSMTMCHEGSIATMQFAAENLNMQVTPEW